MTAPLNLSASAGGQRPKAYSYLRFSSPQQSGGDSLRRQTKAAAQYAAAHGLDLDTKLTFQDLGVSAFRGGNLKRGALGAFLRAVEDGHIQPGSYLLIDALDRMSRQTAWDAFSTFQQLVNEGIILVTLNDGRQYSREAIREQPFVMFEGLIVMIRAHEESLNKARHIAEAWDGKRSARRNGNSTVAMTARGPAWLDFDPAARTFSTNEERAALIVRIFRMYVEDGIGLHGIASCLNREGVPTFGDHGTSRRAAYWHRSYIQKIVTNPAVIGTLVPHKINWIDQQRSRDPLEPIADYYPAVVPQRLWDAAQTLRLSGTRAPAGKSGQIRNILGGLARCPRCGSTMTRVSKGTSKKSGRPSLVCVAAKAKSGCQYYSVQLDLVVDALRNEVSLLHELIPSFDEELEQLVSDKCKSLEQLHNEVGNLVDAVSANPLHSLVEELRKKESELSIIRAEVHDLMDKASLASSDITKQKIEVLSGLLKEEEIDIARVNVLLRQIFREVVVDYEAGCLRMRWLQGGEVPIPYDLTPEGGTPEYVVVTVGHREGQGRIMAIAPAGPPQMSLAESNRKYGGSQFIVEVEDKSRRRRRKTRKPRLSAASTGKQRTPNA